MLDIPSNGPNVIAFMRLVRGDSDRYHSLTPIGLTGLFLVIKPSTTRALSPVSWHWVLPRLRLDGVVLAPSALSRTTSAVELRLRRSPGRVDVVIAGRWHGRSVR